VPRQSGGGCALNINNLMSLGVHITLVATASVS
jgi:hypothetical protein